MKDDKTDRPNPAATAAILTILAAIAAETGAEASPLEVKNRQIMHFLGTRKPMRNKGRNVRGAHHVHNARDGSEKHYFVMHVDGKPSVDHGKTETEYVMTCFMRDYARQVPGKPKLYSLHCAVDGGAWGRRDAWPDATTDSIVYKEHAPWERMKKGQHPYAHLRWRQVGGDEARREATRHYSTYQRVKKEKTPASYASQRLYQWQRSKPHSMDRFKARLRRR